MSYSFAGTTIRVQNINPTDDTDAASTDRHIPGGNVNYTDIGGQQPNKLSLTLFFTSYSNFLSFKSNVGSYGSLVGPDGTVTAVLTRLSRTFRNIGTTGECMAQADFTVLTLAMVANPGTVAHGVSSQTILLYGYATAWVSGTTTFAMSGGTGASLSSYTISGQITTCTVNTGSAAGTLTFSDSADALTCTVTVT